MLITEWPYADWFEFHDCIKTYAPNCSHSEDFDLCMDDIYQWTCDNYDTYTDDFYECVSKRNCAHVLDWAENYTTDEYWTNRVGYVYPTWSRAEPEVLQSSIAFSLNFDLGQADAWINE